MTTTQTADRRAKMLERVRALLAKADSTTFPEEAATFRAKADDLMTAYAIEQWQVDQAQAGVGARPKPEVRNLNFDWWISSSRSDELWTLFCNIADHCRCVVAIRGYRGAKEGMPVIGLPSDLDYLDMMFTHLMLQMGRDLEPSVNPNETVGQNVYRLRQAGQPWERITEQLYVSGMIDLTKGEERKRYTWEVLRGIDPTSDRPEWATVKRSGVWTSVKNRLANANRRFVAEHDLQEERNYVRPAIYQRSFANGFVREVAHRLRQMRGAQEQAGDGTSVALAIRDIRQVALDLYADLFPPVAAKKGRRSRAVTRTLAFDERAYGDGIAAGRRADLASSPDKRVGRTKGELPS